MNMREFKKLSDQTKVNMGYLLHTMRDGHMGQLYGHIPNPSFPNTECIWIGYSGIIVPQAWEMLEPMVGRYYGVPIVAFIRVFEEELLEHGMRIVLLGEGEEAKDQHWAFENRNVCLPPEVINEFFRQLIII